MARSSNVIAFQLAIIAIAIAVSLSVANRSFAQPMGGGSPMGGGPQMGPPAGPQMGPPQGGGNNWATYQRKGFNGGPNFGGPGPGYCNGWGGGYGCFPQQISGNYFERSYPYHLDYFRLRSGAQNSPPTDCPVNTSGSGHWAWCWVPDGNVNTGEVYSTQTTESLPGPFTNQSSATPPALKPATGTAASTLSLP